MPAERTARSRRRAARPRTSASRRVLAWWRRRASSASDASSASSDSSARSSSTIAATSRSRPASRSSHVGPCCVEPPKELVALALDPPELLRRNRHLRVVGIEETGGRCQGLLRSLEGRRRSGEGSIPTRSAPLLRRPRWRLASSSADAVAPAPPSPRRKPVAENRSPWRVTTTAPGWAKDRSKAVRPAALHRHGPVEKSSASSSRSTPGAAARTWSRTRRPTAGDG